MNQHLVEIRLLDPLSERDKVSGALRLLAIEFISAPEKRDAWVERMSSVMRNGYDSVDQGKVERGGAMFVGLKDDTIVSVFTLKFYSRELLGSQQYFVFDESRSRIAVSTFHDISCKLCSVNSGQVISEYDLSYVKNSYRGMNLHQRASELGYKYVNDKHNGRGVSFALIRSGVSGIGTSLGRQLQKHITDRVGTIPFSAYQANDFSVANSVSVSEAKDLIGDEPAFTIHPLSGAAAHMATKFGGTLVAYLATNFSTLFLKCHNSSSFDDIVEERSYFE